MGDEKGDDRAADRKRQRDEDRNRLQETAEQQHQEPVDHHQASAHRRGERREHLAHDLDVAGLADLDPRRQVARGRQRPDRRDRGPERGVAAQIALDRHPPSAVVAVDGGRSVADREVRHHRERRRRAAARRYPQVLQEPDARPRRLVELDPDRDQPIAGVELGEVGVDVAERSDADSVGQRLGRNAEIGGDLRLRRNAQFRPVELRRRDRILDRRDRPHLAGDLVGGRVDDVHVGAGDDQLQVALAVVLEEPVADVRLIGEDRAYRELQVLLRRLAL